MSKITVISYSRSSNNAKLAKALVKDLNAKHIEITESKPRSYFSIGLDRIFNRTPKIEVKKEKVEKDELIIFISPIWMGIPASPLRAYFDKLKDTIDRYVYVTICGGADGKDSNPSIEDDLEKRLGKKPVQVLEYYKADFLNQGSEITRKDTMNHTISEKDLKSILEDSLSHLQSIS